MHIMQWKKYEEFLRLKIFFFLCSSQNTVNMSAKTYTVPNLQITLLCAWFCSDGGLGCSVDVFSGYMWTCYAAALAGSISPHLHRDRWQRSVRSHSRPFQCYIKAELTYEPGITQSLCLRGVHACVCV